MGIFEDIDGKLRGHWWENSMPLMGTLEDIEGGISRPLMVKFKDFTGKFRGH